MKIISSITEITAKEDNFPIFFWDKWKTVEEQLHHKQRLLCVDDEQNVVPFTVYTMSFFKKGDYLYAPLDKNGERLSVEKEKQFLDEFHLFVKQEDLVDVMFPPSHVVLFNSIPSFVDYYNFSLLVVNLQKDENQLFDAISSRNKRYIKQAQNKGLEYVNGLSYLDDFMECYNETVRKEHVASLHKSFFLIWINNLAENISIAGVKDNEVINSSVFSFFDEKNFYASYAGTKSLMDNKGANKYMYWNLYKTCKEQGIKRFIYGGFRNHLNNKDKLYNIQEFKIRMGAEIEEGYHFIKVIHPFKYNLVTFALRVKSLLTGRDCSFVNLKGLDVKKSN